MAAMTRIDQGFSVRLSTDIGKLVKKIAEREDRTIKAVVERAVEAYAKKGRVS